MDKLASGNNYLYARLLLDRARHFILYARQKEMAPYHISPQQAYILFILNNLDHMATLSELAIISDKGINTVSMQITRMEKDGLVKKFRDTPKSTLLKIGLTEKGIDIWKNTSKLKSEKAIMSILSEAECRELIFLLNKIVYKAKEFSIT